MTRETRIVVAGMLWIAAIGGTARAQGDDALVLNKYKILEARMAKVRKYFQAEDYAKCGAEAAACLKDLPAHHEAHFFLGQVYYKRAEFDSALAEASAAEAGFLRFKQIADSIQKRKLEKQLSEKEDLVAVAEAWEEAYDNGACRKAVYKNEMERTRERIAADGKYGETALVDTDAPVPAEYRYFHGNCLFRLRDFAGAEAQYRAALHIDPRHANAATNLINLLYAQKRIDEARAALAQAEANRVAVPPGLKKAVLDAAEK